MTSNVYFIELFNMFHDGSISSIKKVGFEQRDIAMIIDIKYLAELIDSEYSTFNLKIINCTSMLFKLWNNKEAEIVNLSEIQEIINEMEISKATNEDNYVGIQLIGDEITIGGSLLFSCQDIQVFDEKNNLLKYEHIKEICRLYWN